MEAIRTFLGDEAGAVTVDWVVLTAALVGLGLAVTLLLGQAISEPTSGIASSMEAGEMLCPDGCDWTPKRRTSSE